MLKCWVPLVLLIFVAGCDPTVRSYNLAVKNDTVSPLTLNLAKDVPQHEALWASPEDIDEERVRVTPETELGIVVIPPGKTATRTGITGHFEHGAQAVLRIYRGKDLLQRELLAMKPGNDRADVILKPGNNRFVVRDYHGALSIEPVK
jgi:hypothetical protein